MDNCNFKIIYLYVWLVDHSKEKNIIQYVIEIQSMTGVRSFVFLNISHYLFFVCFWQKWVIGVSVIKTPKIICTTKKIETYVSYVVL